MDVGKTLARTALFVDLRTTSRQYAIRAKLGFTSGVLNRPLFEPGELCLRGKGGSMTSHASVGQGKGQLWLSLMNRIALL